MRAFRLPARKARADHRSVFAEFAMRLMAALVALHVGPVARIERFKVIRGGERR